MQPWRRNLWVVAVANFVTMVGMAAFIPFFPDVLRELGVLALGPLSIWSGLLIAGAPLAAAFTGPIWGALGDRYGRKRMVVRSLLAIVVTIGLMGAVTTAGFRARLGLDGWWLTPWPLLLLRVCQGAFSGFIAPALTLVTVGAPPERQARVTAMTQSSLLAGVVVGPVLGAWITQRWGAHVTFHACAALAAAATVLVAALAREAGTPEEGQAAIEPLPPWATLVQAWRDAKGNLSHGGLKAIMLGLFLAQMAGTMVNPVLRLHMELFGGGSHIATTSWAFSATALGQILFAPFWARWVDRVGTRRAIPLTTALTALVYLPQAWVRSVEVFVGLRFLQGIVAAGTVPAAYAHIGRISAVHHRGGFYALTLSSFQLANVVAPLAGGVLAAALGTRPLFLVSALLLCAAAFWTQRRL